MINESKFTEDHRKYFEIIQSVINRMSQNSSQLKQLSVAITTAFIGLDISVKNSSFVSIIFMLLIIFWALDAYYLYQEKKFRRLYAEVIKPNAKICLYDMDITKFSYGFYAYFKVVFSKTLWPLYLALLISSVVILIFHSAS